MRTKAIYSSIESLEARIAPAGVIDVIFDGGNLTLKTLPNGDGAETLVISDGLKANEYLLDPGPGTKLRVNGVELADGQAQFVQDITGLISVSLGAGDDELGLADTKFSVGLKVDLGSGNNSVSLDRATAKSFAYKGGANNDFVSLNLATIAGNTTLDLGAGENSVEIGGALIAGNLAVKSGAGNDKIRSLDPVRIGGSYTAALGDGDNNILQLASLIAGRDVTLTSGKGTDLIRFNGGGDYSIGGSLTVKTGTGADKTDLFSGGIIQIGKNVTFASGGAEGKTIEQGIFGTLGVSVGGKVKFKSGLAKAVNQEISSGSGDVAVAESITFNAGLGKATQSLFALKDLTVAKGIALIAPGGGAQSILTDADGGLGTAAVTGPIKITGGTSIILSVDGDLRGPVNISAGQTAGMGGVQIGSTKANSDLRIHGPVTVKTNSQDGSLFDLNVINATLDSSVILLGGAGVDQLYLSDLQAMGALNIDTGAGDDELRVESFSPLPGGSTFLGAVSFKGGAGDDKVLWSSGDVGKDAVFAAKLVTIDGGAGTDTLVVGAGATFFVPFKTVSVA